MKWKLMIATAALLAAVLVTPASALEYTFDNPAAGDFGEAEGRGGLHGPQPAATGL